MSPDPAITGRPSTGRAITGRPNVAAVVITHGPDPDLDRGLAVLAAQVNELVVVANIPGSRPTLPPDAHYVENEVPVGFATNANRGASHTSAEWIVLANPDTIAEPDAVAQLLTFAAARPRAGIAGPQLNYPDGTWQPSRRLFPTVLGTVVRRTPLRLAFPPARWQRGHYLLDERPTEPVPADWMLGGFLLLRRAMLDDIGGFDEGYRLYGEDIDLCYRAAQAGWERWYVPAARVVHRYAAVIDQRFFTRRTVWHFRGMVRFVRKHPERLRSLV